MPGGGQSKAGLDKREANDEEIDLDLSEGSPERKVIQKDHDEMAEFKSLVSDRSKPAEKTMNRHW